MTKAEIRLHLFGDGPWIQEPDQLDFEHKGIRCQALRSQMGAWLGYCFWPEGHPHRPTSEEEFRYCRKYNVHGGITFCNEEKIGFDCAHADDLTPREQKISAEIEVKHPFSEHMNKMIEELKKKHKKFRTKTYRDMEFVQKHCRNLAEQILDYQKGVWRNDS